MLIKFLKDELKVAKRMVLDKKSRQIDSKDLLENSNKVNDKGKDSYQVESPAFLSCFICGSHDHVITTLKSGKRLVHYYEAI